MSEIPEKLQSRATVKQLAAVGVLATIFIGVLVFQFGTAGASPQPVADPEYRVPAVVPTGNPGSSTVANAATRTARTDDGRRPPRADRAKPDRPWPGFPLAKVLEFDPFALPPGLASVADGIQPVGKAEKSASPKSADTEKDRVKHQQALSQLRQDVVRTIVGTDHGFAAIVGTRTIHVGDRLHGFRVKQIQAEGIILAENQD